MVFAVTKMKIRFSSDDLEEPLNVTLLLQKIPVTAALIASAGLAFTWFALSGRSAPLPPQAQVDKPAAGRMDLTGISNVRRFSEKLLSGSCPEGEEGFKTLAGLGVKTIISVDGARPNVELARKYALRYVHIPVGYDGISEQQAWSIAKAVNDLPGLVYIHCHHGKHRGPAAAAAVRLCLDSKCSVDQAVELMRSAGTDPHYLGLYAVPKKIRRPTTADLDRLPADFPETAEVKQLAQAMVEIDSHFDHIKEIRAAGWMVPPKHSDLDPAHEVRQLVEGFQELGRANLKREDSKQFQQAVSAALKNLHELETSLRPGDKTAMPDRISADAALRRVDADCRACHVKYRDRPKP